MKKQILPLLVAASLYSSDAFSQPRNQSAFNLDNTIENIISYDANSMKKNILVDAFSEMGKDTTFNNTFYNARLKAEIDLWKTIFSLDSTHSIVYNKQTFEIIDTIETRFGRDYGHQREIDKHVVDSIHLALTGKHAPRLRKDKIYSFRFGRKNMVEESLQRMLPFIPIYAERLKEENLPPSTMLIPIYESSFKPFVRSYAGAVGQFQFMSGTARDFKLDFSDQKDARGFCHYDFRRSYIDSFEAFVSYLKKAQDRFGDYHSFIPTSFNIGLYSNKFKVKDKEEEIKALQAMGFAPRSYFSELVALTQMMKEFDTHFPEFDFSYEDLQFRKVTKTIRPHEVPSVYKINLDTFHELNPQYMKGVNTYVIKEGRNIVLPKSPDFFLD